MLQSELERVEALFLELRAEIRELRMQAVPQLLTPKMAAARLSVGLTKLKELIRRGEILTVTLGGRQMIPASEIERVSTPPEKRQQVKRARWVPLKK